MNNRKPNLNRKNDSLINYIMIALICLLILALIGFIISSLFAGGGDKNKNNETTMETTAEEAPAINTIGETSAEETQAETSQEVKETEKETQSETTKEEVQTEAETAVEVETKKETQAEVRVETEAETKKETQAETQTQTTERKPVNTANNVQRKNNRTQANPYAAIASDAQIQKASDAELVDMIIRGDLGYGAERRDILLKNGIDPDYMSNLVSKKLSR